MRVRSHLKTIKYASAATVASQDKDGNAERNKHERSDGYCNELYSPRQTETVFTAPHDDGDYQKREPEECWNSTKRHMENDIRPILRGTHHSNFGSQLRMMYREAVQTRSRLLLRRCASWYVLANGRA